MLKETTGAFNGARNHDWRVSADHESDALSTAPRRLLIGYFMAHPRLPCPYYSKNNMYIMFPSIIQLRTMLALQQIGMYINIIHPLNTWRIKSTESSVWTVPHIHYDLGVKRSTLCSYRMFGSFLCAAYSISHDANDFVASKPRDYEFESHRRFSLKFYLFTICFKNAIEQILKHDWQNMVKYCSPLLLVW